MPFAVQSVMDLLMLSFIVHVCFLFFAIKAKFKTTDSLNVSYTVITNYPRLELDITAGLC